MTETAFVTGGTGALGVHVTKHLLSLGWRVVTTFTEPSKAARLESHDRLELVQCDVAVPTELTAAVSVAAGDPDAPLTALVNLIGGFESGPRTHEADLEAIDRQLDLNVRTTYTVLRATLPHLIANGGGSVVSMSSGAAVKPFPGGTAYSTSKAAVLALAESIAVEYKKDHIRSNALLPGVIDSPANRAAMPNSDRSSWVDPTDVAKVIAFLLSDDSVPITGAAIPLGL
ncbi:SDR family NAD(P)-dependent oxidoreductase [Rhodococcus spongiicola]|uniref:SDR family NAD(P)-dependent oxidoreductase n=1 Tax=Rhodococcus spongiicola TaxID=2487352 RepID=A0A438B6Y5_9NOCA|nr:SDR family NAD(P)-dependent oxidoreductase [Rhodococcus spongiicola]RVW06714.1 SDR family NAD(P)-dependent oxidoreductase [Rhodococcus spongiicola]